MTAPTGTIEAPPRQRLTQSLVILAVMVASGIVAFIIVSAMRHKPATNVHGDREAAFRSAQAFHVHRNLPSSRSRSMPSDGKAHGDTPLTITLNVGNHCVRPQNIENNLHEALPDVMIHQTTFIDRNLQ